LLHVLSAAAVASGARAQEATVLLGRANAEGQDTYAYQLEYRAPLVRYLDASFSYVNEGHLFDHQRDGGAVQLWAVTPRWRDRLDFALGVGPYFYFDTQSLIRPYPEPWYRNYHSIAEIYTGSLTYSPTEHWFIRLNLSEVHAPGDVDTHLVLLGAGYRPGASGGPSEAEISPGINQLEVFGGQTSENNYYTSYHNETTLTYGIEYRRAMTRHLELSAAWLSENDGVSGRRNGALAEIWLAQRLSGRFSVGIGAGPYYTLKRYRGDDGLRAARLTGVLSMTAGWQLTRSLLVRFSWHRGLTHDDQDRDILTLGLAWGWGS
jgi:hypothetical protein